MAPVNSVSEFADKLEPSVIDSMDAIGQAIHKAGYGTAVIGADMDYDMEPVRVRWLIHTWYPGRPESLESMDMIIAFTILQSAENPVKMVPFVEIFNYEGSFLDEIELSEALTLQDPSWKDVITSLKEKADDIVLILDEYFPKPTKRRWMIRFSSPENFITHPSIHTNEAIAKQDVAARLTLMLSKIERLFWEFEVLRMYSGWNSASTYAIAQIRFLLQQGESFTALRKYHEFLDRLEPALRSRVNRKAGSLQVERLGGYPEEED